MSGQPVPGSLFIYAPNKWAPIIFAVAFGISAVGHIWQCSKYKSFRLIGLHPLCATLFTAGYILREIGAYNYLYTPRNLIIFILSQVFIYICPPLLELANYHILARTFLYIPHQAPLPPSLVLRIFGALMAIVELLNSLGVALSANPSSTHEKQHLGKSLTIAALTIQLLVIIVFIILAAIFHRRCFKANIHVRGVTTPLYTLYVSMGLILVRCLYRLVEHTGNTTVKLKDLESLQALSPILRYEWFFYVFEATLMLVNSVLWNVWNPGRYLPRDRRVYLSRDGKTQVVREEEKDDRSLLFKILHVLTFGLLFGRGAVSAGKGNGSFEELRGYPPGTQGGCEVN